MGSQVSDPDKWYQHLLDLCDRYVQPDHQGGYIVGSGTKYRHLKEMESLKREMEDQHIVVNLVSPVAQATEMAKSKIKREREMVERKTSPLRRRRFYRSTTKDYL